jgi:TM2 domain-containing membrane protein YozV
MALFIFIGAIISLFGAMGFGYIAREKGHNSETYGTVCFLLPLIGWLMVIALPNKAQHEELLNALYAAQAPGTMPAKLSDELPKL